LKLSVVGPLQAEVERRLRERWSPQQISNRLVLDFPDDAEMRVSHETIYRTLYLRARGTLKKELVTALRTGRVQRRSRGRTQNPASGRLKDMILIGERPPDVDDRSVPGHWEGDLVMGKLGQSSIATIVERKTRFTMLVALPDGRRATEVRTAVAQQLVQLPDELRRSLTWDQGKEMAQHQQFTIETGIDVYFCEPHRPWQRGTNENTNGLIRQYFPKGVDLNNVSQLRLDTVARELNARPRRALDWKTPAEMFADVVAMTV